MLNRRTSSLMFLPAILAVAIACTAFVPAKGNTVGIKGEMLGIRIALPWTFEVATPEEIVNNCVSTHINTIVATINQQSLADPRLKELIERSHVAGIGFHAVLSAINAKGYDIPGEDLNAIYHGVDSNCEMQDKWLDPCKPAVRGMIFQMVSQMCDLDIDGLQLDYIRWGGPEMGHSAEDQAAWETWNQQNPEGNWEDWRDSVITGYIRDLGALVKQKRPDALFSCSSWTVGPGWPHKTILTEWGEGYGWEQGQDFDAMVENVDYIRPMLYSCLFYKKPSWSAKLAGFAVKNARGRADVVVGGAFAVGERENKRGTWITGEELRAMIAGIRQSGACGLVMYHYNHLFNPKVASDYAEFDYAGILREMFPPVSENPGYVK